jgi:hypothetical protein
MATETPLPLTINGESAVEFIKRAYGLELGGTPRFDLNDPVQAELRMIHGWIDMAQRDALKERAS